jgi:hypothetical protein
MAGRTLSLVFALTLLGGAGCDSVVCVSVVINPSVITLTPGSTSVGGATFTLQIIGRDFPSDSVVEWNGTARPTAFMSSGELHATIFTTDLAQAGTVLVTVSSTTPCGTRVSNVARFIVAP